MRPKPAETSRLNDCSKIQTFHCIHWVTLATLPLLTFFSSLAVAMTLNPAFNENQWNFSRNLDYKQIKPFVKIKAWRCLKENSLSTHLMMNNNHWKLTDAHENRQPLKGLERSESDGHRPQSKSEENLISDSLSVNHWIHLCDFNETSSAILFDIQVKPLWLDLQAFRGELLFCLVTGLTCWKVDKQTTNKIGRCRGKIENPWGNFKSLITYPSRSPRRPCRRLGSPLNQESRKMTSFN